MRITGTEGTRYQLAIDRFREGEPLVFENLSLRLAKDDQVHCSIAAAWQPESITHERAQADFEAAFETVARLLQSSAELASTIEDREIRYELFHDYGTGAIRVAALDQGRVAWANGFPRSKHAV
jgi:phenylalanyl-tRNA synthetase beta subunit